MTVLYTSDEPLLPCPFCNGETHWAVWADWLACPVRDIILEKGESLTLSSSSNTTQEEALTWPC